VTTKEEQPGGCFLCRYAAEPQNDAANLVVARGKRTLTVLNRFPYNNGHLLVAPLAHKAGLPELDDEELLECQQVVVRMTELLSRRMSAEGFNIGLNLGKVAGAGLPGHLHWHVVPRWNGDTNFMPLLADVNVIPQSLAALYGLLRQ
jgi:ATP adenylyltransferase